MAIRDIALLLATIDSLRQYDVEGDTELMAKLSSRIANMQDAGWRETATRKAESIGKDRRDHPIDLLQCGPEKLSPSAPG
jgi:hypothetical protein